MMTSNDVLEEQHKAYWAELEMANGETAQLGIYIQRIIQSQDLVAWQADPAGFDQWLRGEICKFVNNCYGRIRVRQGGGR